MQFGGSVYLTIFVFRVVHVIVSRIKEFKNSIINASLKLTCVVNKVAVTLVTWIVTFICYLLYTIY